MRVNKQEENKAIIDAINLLEKGECRDRRKYLLDVRYGGVSINGFVFEQSDWCWIVWKQTDIDKNPEYNGESLAKVVPRVFLKDIEAILDAQYWTYI